jgi:3-deoxy-D-manno-octulosonate 8-phosphate phosphatase (KDO 8-P phosphatase)
MKINYSKFSKIKFLLFDFEGVLFNKSISNEDEFIENSKDILSSFIDTVHEYGLKIGIITARTEDKVTEFLQTIGFDELFISSIDKVSPVEKMLNKHNLDFDEILYAGDDILDLPLLQKAGFTVCPVDARRELKRVADYICENRGGENILPEIINLIEESKVVNS